MTNYRPILSVGETYHVFNRSIADELIFDNEGYLNQMMSIVDFYRFQQKIRLSYLKNLPDILQEDYLKQVKLSPPQVEIYAFSIMPTHYHFLTKQIAEKGISRFISNVQNSYAKSFNLIHDRHGSVFQASFKSKLIVTNEQFIHISRYVHLNHVASKLIEFEQLKTYPYSSFYWYINQNFNKFVNVKPILSYFKTIDYTKFLQNQVDYQRKLRSIKNLLID